MTHGLSHHRYYNHAKAKIMKKGFQWGSLTLEQKMELVLNYEQTKSQRHGLSKHKNYWRAVRKAGGAWVKMTIEEKRQTILNETGSHL